MIAIINNGNPCICNDSGIIMNRLYPNGARCISMSPNQKYIAAGFDDCVKIYSLPHGYMSYNIIILNGPVAAVSFRDDQSVVVSYRKGGGGVFSINGSLLACFY